MYCTKCGKEHTGPAELCPECTSAQPPPAPPKKGNGLSIASLVLGVCGIGLLAFIFGLIALKQKREGRGMAIAGVVLGAIGTFVPILVILFATGVFLAARPQAGRAVRRPTPTLASPSMFAERMEKRLDKVEQKVLKAGLSPADQERFQTEVDACRTALLRLREPDLSQDVTEDLEKEAQERYIALKKLARAALSGDPDSD